MKKIYFLLTGILFFNVTVRAQWSLGGNVVSSLQWFGSQNNESIRIRVNDSLAGWLDATGTFNTYFGIYSVSPNSGQSNNTGFGYSALHKNSANYNTAVGASALGSSTTSSYNSAFGYNALSGKNTGGVYGENSAFGASALTSNDSGYQNTAMGYVAMSVNSSGWGNSGFGVAALRNGTSAFNNTAIGYDALDGNHTGSENSAVGAYALAYSNTLGSYNTAMGDSALTSSSGSYNTAVGATSLISNTTGQYNVTVGYSSSDSNSTGSENTAVGAKSGSTSGALSNTTALGYGTTVSSSNEVRVGNSSVTSIGGFANWSNISDGRVKKHIQENVPGLAFIKLLRPVTYNLDVMGINKMVYHGRPDPNDQESVTKKEQIVYSGFVAQEVEAVAKKLKYDFSGVDAPGSQNGLYGLRYSEFVVPLVKATQELNGTVDSLTNVVSTLQSQIADLQAQINEIKKSGALNNKAVLLQNIPNPFTGLTTVAYTIPNNAKSAQLVVGNMSGQVLAAIPLADKGQGQTSFDGSQLASGTYYYTLVIDGKTVDTKKMLVVK